MNTRLCSVVLGALLALGAAACGGKKTSGAGGGEQGGAGGQGQGGSGGQGGACDPTYSCAKAIDPTGDSGLLCEGAHAMLFDALTNCICMGACTPKCGANVCSDLDETADCTACIDDAAAGCGKELQACTSDK